MAAAASRVLRGRSDGCGFRVPGGRGVAFIGADVPLACGPRRGRGGTGSDSGRVRVRLEVGDAERVPRVGERRREGKGDGLGRERKWAGARKMGRGKGFLGRGVKEKKKEMGWAEREKVLHFSETVQTLSI